MYTYFFNMINKKSKTRKEALPYSKELSRATKRAEKNFPAVIGSKCACTYRQFHSDVGMSSRAHSITP